MSDFSKQYLSFLKNEFSGLNLTSFNTEKEIQNKLYEDSIYPPKVSKVFFEMINMQGLIVDIGFGGGFPILPLAQMFPEKNFVGIESKNKKLLAVKFIASKMDIKNITLIHSRYENIVFDIPTLITFKAVGDIEELLKNLKTTSCVRVFFYKGQKDKNYNFNKISKWREIEYLETVDANNETRVLIGVENKNVPCGTFLKNNKNLVNLSDFI